MTTSPWDGRSRAPLRAGLALVSAFDACLLGAHVMAGHPDGRSITGAGARIFLQLCGRPVLVVPLVLLILAPLVLFARRRRSLLSGAIALAGLTILSTALTLLQGHASRNFYTCGAALFGWLCGELAARGAGGERRSARIDAWAEAGAAGAFAATYFAAGVSKMMARGLVWAEAASLQSLVLSQHSITDASWLGAYAGAIAHSRTLAMTLTVATLVVELGALAYFVGSRCRLLWGALFIAFHLNVFLLTGIPYLENVLLAGLLSFPWPLLRRRAPLAVHAHADEPAATWRVMAAPAGLLLVAAIGVGFIPGRLRPVGDPYAGPGPATSARPAGSASRGAAVPTSSELGPLQVGSSLVDGWSVRRIEPRPRAARVELGRGTKRVVLVLSLDKPTHREGPFSKGGVDVSYRSTPVAVHAFRPAARALVARLEAAASKATLREALEQWLRQARPPGPAR